MNVFDVIVLVILGISSLVGLAALIKGKKALEKIIALDVLTTLITAFLLFISFIVKSELILDIAIIYAVLSFGAVLVVARYKERGF